uniref:Secreted protein n=1 Tax=Anguilla anguilla TaxID=7936 RepID=A0A0E9RWN0_ANGAN
MWTLGCGRCCTWLPLTFVCASPIHDLQYDRKWHLISHALEESTSLSAPSWIYKKKCCQSVVAMSIAMQA